MWYFNRVDLCKNPDGVCYTPYLLFHLATCYGFHYLYFTDRRTGAQ